MYKSFSYCGFLLLFTVCLVTSAQAADYKALFQQAREAEQAKQLPQALTLYQQALQANPPEKPKNAALFWYLIGSIQQRLQDFAAAEKAYQQSLQLREQHLGKTHGAVAVSLSGLAGVYAALGDYQRALPLYQRALEIDEQAHGAKHRKVAVALNNLAETYRHLGQFKAAEPLLKRALIIDKAAWGLASPRIAMRLSNLAEIYRQQGNYAEAKSLLFKALDIDQVALQAGENDPLNVAIRLNNLGRLYVTLGAYAQADDYYKKALAIWGEHVGEQQAQYAVGLNNRAWVHHALENYSQAEDLYQQALRINELIYGDKHLTVAISLNNLALLFTEQQQYDKAEPLFIRAQAIWEAQLGEEHPQVAMVLHNRAKLQRAQGDYAEAEKALHKALAIAKVANQPELLWAVLDNLSQTLAAHGEKQAAILLGKEAVNTLQSLRVNLAQLDKTLQRSFLQDKAEVYQRLVGLLLDLGRTAEASQVQRMLKEEEYFDFVRREAEQAAVKLTKISFTPDEKPWVKQAHQLYDKFSQVGERLSNIRFKPQTEEQKKQASQGLRGEFQETLHDFQSYFDKLKNNFATKLEEQSLQQALQSQQQGLVELAQEYQVLRQKDTLSETEERRKQTLRKELIEARKQFNACLQDIQDIGNAKAQNLDTLQALQSTLRELGHGVVLINYIITPDKLRMILTTPDVQLCREAAVSAEQLSLEIAKFRDFFKAPPDPRRPYLLRFMLQQANTLYNYLIQPLSKDLIAAQAQTLMLSLDGELRYVPMVALHDGEQYLAQRYAVAMFTEAARDKLKDSPVPAWRIAGLGVSKALRDMNPLPSVEKELEGIIRRSPEDQDGVAEGDIKLNEQFDQMTLLDALEQDYPVLHIASHFVFQPHTDQDAYLLLGNGEILSLAEVRVGYDFNNVDLLTLSACQTAVGSVGQGKEVEGFGALAQKQGAKSVIATLWPVDDRSTGLFMQHFYKVHQTQTAPTKIAAMQQVQQAFISAAEQTRRVGDSKPVKAASLYPKDFAHPYYWAPFVLMGNWL